MHRSALFVVIPVLLSSVMTFANEPTVPGFRKIQVTTEYYAEGCGYGDINKDGHRDLVCGPFWFAGPDYKSRTAIYEGKSFPNDRGYSDNFFSFIDDFDGDGWPDLLKIGLPGTPAFWFQNPGNAQGLWKKRLAFAVVDNEAPTFADLTGDKRPELLCTFEGRLGFIKPQKDNVDAEWKWTSLSEKGSWHRYSHGLGAGDINGDGRKDFLMPEGWWEQPADADGAWRHHKVRFARGGAEIYAFDVDGDGDNDVVSSQNAHAYGLSWFESDKTESGVSFKPHVIMPSSIPKKDEAPAAGTVNFSQLHAIDCDDVDGDGRIDIVAGKCYWAHNGADPGARDPSVIYWFRNTVRDGKVYFEPHLIDNNSGVGRGINIVDMNGDGRKDVIAANKKGTFVFLQQ